MKPVSWVWLLWVVPALHAQERLQITINPQKAAAPEITYQEVGPGKLKVVVTDSSGPVGGLELEDFEIRSALSRYELSCVQPLVRSENAEVSLFLCIDNSFSMSDHLTLLKNTLHELLLNVGPGVEVAMAFFEEGASPGLRIGEEVIPNIQAHGLSRDREETRRRYTSHLRPGRLTNKTYLYDEIFAGARLAGASRGQRYLIVLSDGLDNASKKSREDIRRLIPELAGVVFYTIDFLKDTNEFLVELAARSGGRHFLAKRAEELGRIFAEITREIVTLSGYLISYRIPAAFLAGRVMQEDRCTPLPGARLLLTPLDHAAQAQQVTVNDRGLYSAKAALPHRWRLMASAPDHLADSTEIEVSEETLYVADFALPAATIALSGRVSDAGAAPLPQAEVTVTDLETGERLLAAATDSLGFYRVTARVHKRLLITATKPGYTFANLETEAVTAATTLPEIVLGLTAEGVVSEFRFLFEFNSDKLDLSDIATQTQLRGCVAFVKRELGKTPTRTVRLAGWTDNVGELNYNMDLSNRRAQYLRNYLIAQGVPAARIVATGSGISNKYDNATEEGRRLNRRTDVVFFDRK
ncbi:MAG: carboxypeptidase regulatory-like domain-containing protein [candidate division KSB1 bacterium]|nr:carboxypeptidase regulatory-like domain-containing protein [candidate division KSB1 bacterium]MDZ7272628.1 carboxypeptidase regulatory-like domain-containing protein [candidate division KSB1 bacterium]MDZ7284350.1 carboxypeptidase regulatory-like domain-containing protein [candidate division KSB1 bacterium]MDZ7297254.1 carboxypeptidase regulatory-like domain-containing protein [candidate division KSB1 bacterium]MDZ7307570.1 carboxypeptidase regulatory-like domain-containing protein [candidat